MVLSISPVDWAAEWLHPVSPSYKYVGPVLAEPGKALPAHLEVRLCLFARSLAAPRTRYVCKYASMCGCACKHSCRNAHVVVQSLSCRTQPAYPYGCLDMIGNKAALFEERLHAQEYMEAAGKQGVLLVSMGTVVELGTQS